MKERKKRKGKKIGGMDEIRDEEVKNRSDNKNLACLLSKEDCCKSFFLI